VHKLAAISVATKSTPEVLAMLLVIMVISAICTVALAELEVNAVWTSVRCSLVLIIVAQLRIIAAV